jgi:hypothetical protein
VQAAVFGLVFVLGPRTGMLRRPDVEPVVQA